MPGRRRDLESSRRSGGRLKRPVDGVSSVVQGAPDRPPGPAAWRGPGPERSKEEYGMKNTLMFLLASLLLAFSLTACGVPYR